MNQELALEVLLAGNSALLTGPAGAGKTFVLNQFIAQAKAAGKKVAVTATTGLAATHLGGTTIHAWSGIGVRDAVPSGFADNLSKARRETIEKADILIIDEISMLHDFRLDMVDEICRLVRRKDEPFGGIQLVMSGDFFQLPPINRGAERVGGFVVTSQAWQELQPAILYLQEQHRQDDEALLDILNALRSNTLRRHHAESLLARVDAVPDDDTITELHTVNVDVDTINAHRLEQLPGDIYTYERVSTGGQTYVDSLQRSVLAPSTLELKKGALVMAVKNSATRQFVNGSIGTVVDFEPGTSYPIVQFKNGRTVTMVPDSWELRDGDKKRASISQIPLRLAWAITVHKSQGMTLDAARIDLRKAFVPGMGYVALSRVKNLHHLFLYGINRTALQVSEDTLAINEVLTETAAKDAQRFSHLLQNAKKRKQATTKAASSASQARGISWAEKVAKMRETHPNAFKPWTKQDDALLQQYFYNGESIESMMEQLGRHRGSIIVRLKKLLGDDVVQESGK